MINFLQNVTAHVTACVIHNVESYCISALVVWIMLLSYCCIHQADCPNKEMGTAFYNIIGTTIHNYYSHKLHIKVSSPLYSYYCYLSIVSLHLSNRDCLSPLLAAMSRVITKRWAVSSILKFSQCAESNVKVDLSVWVQPYLSKGNMECPPVLGQCVRHQLGLMYKQMYYWLTTANDLYHNTVLWYLISHYD